MKQMTTVRITAFRISHTYRLQHTFEYNMNKSRNKFELLPILSRRKLRQLPLSAQLDGGSEELRKFPGDDAAHLLIGPQGL